MVTFTFAKKNWRTTPKIIYVVELPDSDDLSRGGSFKEIELSWLSCAG
jgi:hypothetical protein